MVSGPSQVDSPEMLSNPVLCFLRVVPSFLTLLEDTGLNTNGMEWDGRSLNVVFWCMKMVPLGGVLKLVSTGSTACWHWLQQVVLRYVTFVNHYPDILWLFLSNEENKVIVVISGIGTSCHEPTVHIFEVMLKKGKEKSSDSFEKLILLIKCM